jgi:hypothetical protein
VGGGWKDLQHPTASAPVTTLVLPVVQQHFNMAFNDGTIKRMQRRVEELTASFGEGADRFEAEALFTGPSVYFHLKTRRLLNERRSITDCHERALASCLEDDYFLESLYATLTSWGLHRMGPMKAKLVGFDDFKRALRNRRDAICKLTRYRIGALHQNEVGAITQEVWKLVEGLEIGLSEAKIVRGTKALHHLLPELVPPMDRAYTLKFFLHVTHFDESKEEMAFHQIFPQFWRISIRCAAEVEKRLLKGGDWNTSFTKVLDNAIVGYVRAHPDV